MALEQKLQRIRVWDLPTRLFHWGLVLAVTVAVLSAKLGGNAMVWHMRAGYCVLALLGFRVLWGLVGGRWSRFSRFVYGPAALWRYLRHQARAGDRFEVGHNPLGALSVLAMLAWLLLQAASGLIADDQIATAGPLVAKVSSATSEVWTAHHTTWGQWGVFGLLGLHVSAILFHRWIKKKDLLGPMLSGDQLLAEPVEPARDAWPQRLLALALLALSGLVVAWLVGAVGSGAGA